MFLTGVLHGIVPCYCTLSDRHMNTPVICPVCRTDPEDLRHMLFFCDRAKSVWKELGLSETIEAAATDERSGSVILERLLCAEISGGNIPIANGIEMIMVAGWYLWWDRRKISHKETCGSAARSAMSIRGIVANTLTTKLKVLTRSMRWVRSAAGVIKLNVDA